MSEDPNTPWWLQGGQDNQSPSRPISSSHIPYDDDGSLPSLPSFSGPDGESFPLSAPPLPRRSARPAGQPAPAIPKTQRRAPRWVAPVATIALALLLSFIVLAVTSGHDNGTFLGLGGVQPTATRIGYARAAKITFTRTTQSITAPSATLIAATDGSGQIKATVQTASVNGATSGAIQGIYSPGSQITINLTVTNNDTVSHLSSGTVTTTDKKVTCTLQGSNIVVNANSSLKQDCVGPIQRIPAEDWIVSIGKLDYSGHNDIGGQDPGYYVPSNCGDSSSLKAATQNSLQGQLNLAGETIVVFGPTFHFSNLTCSPSSGAQISQSPFTYTQKIDATASQTVFALADLQAVASHQLQTKLPQDYILSTSQICPSGPQIDSGATATKATITCPASGTAAWNWTPDTLTQLAHSIEETSPDTASLQLNKTPGIVVGSVKILLIGGSELPQDPSKITFTITP